MAKTTICTNEFLKSNPFTKACTFMNDRCKTAKIKGKIRRVCSSYSCCMPCRTTKCRRNSKSRLHLYHEILLKIFNDVRGVAEFTCIKTVDPGLMKFHWVVLEISRLTYMFYSDHEPHVTWHIIIGMRAMYGHLIVINCHCRNKSENSEEWQMVVWSIIDIVMLGLYELSNFNVTLILSQSARQRFRSNFFFGKSCT